MLTIHDFAKATFAPWPGSSELPEAATWIDANSPTAEEAAFLKRALGVEPPTLEEMSAIEQSSRFYRLGEALCITIPLPKRENNGEAFQHPLALIWTPATLLTVRYEHLKPCEPDYLTQIQVERDSGGFGACVGLLEGIVNHLSDELEVLTARLDEYSRTIFARPRPGEQTGLRGGVLRSMIGDIGRQRHFHSLAEEALLTLSRGLTFLGAHIGARVPAAGHARLAEIARDAEALSALETRLSDRIQFLLDASLGLVNVEQNEIFKVLTIVSVIGIPPTLIASMYGMNFEVMPELKWQYGYPIALATIVLSALLPLLWFRWKRWW